MMSADVNMSEYPTNTTTNDVNNSLSNSSSSLWPIIQRGCAYCMPVCSPLIILLNSLFLVSVAVFRKLHTPHNLMLTSLAVGDLLAGSCFAPLMAWEYFSSSQFIKNSNKTTCLYMYALSYICSCGSVLNLMMISVDRYFAIGHSLRYRNTMTISKARSVILGTWAYLLLTASIPAMGFNKYQPGQCIFAEIMPNEYLNFAMLNVLAGILISLVLNIKVCQLVKEQRKTMRGLAHCYMQFTQRARTVKMSNLLFTMLVCFWLPVVFVGPLLLKDPENVKLRAVILLNMIVWLLVNSLTNPLVYAVIKPQYRRAYRILLTTPPWKWFQVRNNKLGQDYLSSSQTRQKRSPQDVILRTQVVRMAVGRQTLRDIDRFVQVGQAVSRQNGTFLLNFIFNSFATRR